MKSSRHFQPTWPLLLKLSSFEFLIPHCHWKISNGLRGQFFFEFEIFDVRCGISVPKDIKMGGVTITLTKIVVTTRPTVTTALDTKLKPGQHSPVFRESNISKRSSTGVNLQPIYEPISSHFFFQNFTSLFLAAGTKLAQKWHFRSQTFPPCQHEKSSN